jgi:hypothetical protein
VLRAELGATWAFAPGTASRQSTDIVHNEVFFMRLYS